MFKPYERLVPVRRSRAKRLLRLAEATPTGEYLVRGCSQKPACAQYHTLRLSPSTPRIKPVRLRANWVVHHLTIGTPVRNLIDAAGVGNSGVRTLVDLLDFVPRVDPVEARRLLERG